MMFTEFETASDLYHDILMITCLQQTLKFSFQKLVYYILCI